LRDLPHPQVAERSEFPTKAAVAEQQQVAYTKQQKEQKFHKKKAKNCLTL
jgi:hypothetical protein